MFDPITGAIDKTSVEYIYERHQRRIAMEASPVRRSSFGNSSVLREQSPTDPKRRESAMHIDLSNLGQLARDHHGSPRLMPMVANPLDPVPPPSCSASIRATISGESDDAFAMSTQVAFSPTRGSSFRRTSVLGALDSSLKMEVQKKMEVKPVVTAEFDENFKRRLNSITSRNTADHIEVVKQRRRSSLTEQQQQILQRRSSKLMEAVKVNSDESQGNEESFLADSMWDRPEPPPQSNNNAAASGGDQTSPMKGSPLLAAKVGGSRAKEEQAKRQQEEKIYFITQWKLFVAVGLSCQLFVERLEMLRASAFLAVRLRPVVQRKRAQYQRRKEREALTLERLPRNPRPTPALIRQMAGDFFDGCSEPLLESLLKSAVPRSFREGEYIMFEGDYDRVMYLLTKGRVEIQIREKMLRDKRRRRDNCTGKFEMAAPAYVGEFALLCKEPRSASVQCMSDVDTWILSDSVLEETLKQMPQEFFQKQKAAAELRRKANLEKYFKYRADMIREDPLFHHWCMGALREMSDRLQPVSKLPGDILYSVGDFDPALYIVSTGTVELRRLSSGTVTTPEGEEQLKQLGQVQLMTHTQVFGAYEAFFAQERRVHTARCLTNCEIWRLPRQDLLDIGINDPGALVSSRDMVMQQKLNQILKTPKAPPYFAKDPFLSFVLTPYFLNQSWQLAHPRIIPANSQLAIEGDDHRNLYVIVSGAFQVSYLTPDLKKYDEKIVVAPIHGGVYSGSNIKNDNLVAMHPSVVFCEGREESQSEAAGGENTTVSKPRASASEIGIVIGAFEFASRSQRWTLSARCVTTCEALVIDKNEMLALIPPLLTELWTTEKMPMKLILDRYKHRCVSRLLTDHNKVSAMFAAKKAQDANAKKPWEHRGSKVALE